MSVLHNDNYIRSDRLNRIISRGLQTGPPLLQDREVQPEHRQDRGAPVRQEERHQQGGDEGDEDNAGVATRQRQLFHRSLRGDVNRPP